jgi:hypothetical protein
MPRPGARDLLAADFGDLLRVAEAQGEYSRQGNKEKCANLKCLHLDPSEKMH